MASQAFLSEAILDNTHIHIRRLHVPKNHREEPFATARDPIEIQCRTIWP